MSDTTIRRPIRWHSAQQTHVGKVRDINEDSILASQHDQLWVVADGMGGYEAGNVASQMVVKSLEDIVFEPSLNETVNQVEDCLIDVNQRILEYADIMLDGRTLGSTAVVFLIKGGVGVCFWAGDSRLYRLRHGQFEQISRDHSQVQELIDQGYLAPEEADSHPDSNVITRAIGATQDLFIDVTAFNVQLGDTYLLCSDGLYNMVAKDQIHETLQNQPIEEAVETLIQTTLENGATDNVSVVLVKGEQGTLAEDEANVEEAAE